MRRSISALPIAEDEYSQDGEQRFRRDLEQSNFSIEQRVGDVEDMSSSVVIKSKLRLDMLMFRASIQEFV